MSERASFHPRTGDWHAPHADHDDSAYDIRHTTSISSRAIIARPSLRQQAAYAADSTRAARPRRRRKPAPKPPAVTPKGYTLGHAGRQIRIGPVAFWICVGSLVIMAGWSAVTATYFAFHDEVLARLISRQAAMQFAYEDRIAEMRAQVDRVTSRQLLDQEQFERKLDLIAKRQSAIEARSSSLGALNDPATTGSIRPPTRSIAPREPAGAANSTVADQRDTTPPAPCRSSATRC